MRLQLLKPSVLKALKRFNHKWSYVSGTAQEPLLGQTLGQVIDQSAEKYGDKIGFVSMHQNLQKSFLQIRDDAEQLAAGFLSLGLQPGDRVGIWGPNSYEWYQTQMAAAKAGLILVNVNPAYKSHELLYCLNKVGIKTLVSARSFKTTDYLKLIKELVPDLEDNKFCENVPSLRHVVMMRKKDDALAKGTLIFDDVVQSGGESEKQQVKELATAIQMDDAVNIQFTSGTTGSPKGATLSHHNIVNNAYFLGIRMGYNLKDHATCCCVPLYHTFGCVIGNLASLIFGNKHVITGPHFNAVDCLDAMEKHKCTSVYGTPTMFTDMIAEQKKNPRNLNSVETGIMSGAPCPVQLCKETIEILNMKRFTTAYGLTETSPLVFQGFPEDSVDLRTKTIGYPSAHTEVKIVDEGGKVLPTGSPGELLVRGYNVMLGYWDDPEKTSELISRDRWLHSGDIAVMYENGYAQIVGRMKDLVIRGGENLYPREIEEVLHHHDAIADAYVVGVPDERFGEELCAWIKLRENAKLTADEVKTFCKSQIAHFKVPKYILFETEFPTTVTGKIQKYKMREMSISKLGLEEVK